MKTKVAAPVDKVIDNMQAPVTKLDKLVVMLRKQGGSTIAELSDGAGCRCIQCAARWPAR